MTHSHNSRITTTFCASFFLLSAGCHAADAVDINLAELESQRYEAMVKQNTDFLESTLSDNLIFTHASAKIDTKESFLDTLSAGSLVYKSIETEDVKVKKFQSFGIVTGTSRLQLEINGKNRRLQLRFTSVWMQENGQWKIVAYQSTHMP